MHEVTKQDLEDQLADYEEEVKKLQHSLNQQQITHKNISQEKEDMEEYDESRENQFQEQQK